MSKFLADEWMVEYDFATPQMEKAIFGSEEVGSPVPHTPLSVAF